MRLDSLRKFCLQLLALIPLINLLGVINLLLCDRPKHIDEFSKSGLTVKTIRVDKRNLPVEEISFKTLNYEKFENEKWEESNLFEEMSSKFLWVIYKIDDGKTILDNVFFWSMSLKDLDFIKMKWKEYTKFLKAGDFRSSYFMDEESFYYLKIKKLFQRNLAELFFGRLGNAFSSKMKTEKY